MIVGGGSWRVIPSTWLWFANGGRPSIPPLPGSCALRTVGKSQNRLWAFPLPPSPPDLHLPDFTAIPRHFRFSSHPSQTERERDDHRREIPRPCATLPKRREITVANAHARTILRAILLGISRPGITSTIQSLQVGGRKRTHTGRRTETSQQPRIPSAARQSSST
jgi:hypothetical protein